MGICVFPQAPLKAEKKLYICPVIFSFFGGKSPNAFWLSRSKPNTEVTRRCVKSYCISVPNSSHGLLLKMITSTPCIYTVLYNAMRTFSPDATKKSKRKIIANIASFKFLIYGD